MLKREVSCKPWLEHEARYPGTGLLDSSIAAASAQTLGNAVATRPSEESSFLLAAPPMSCFPCAGLDSQRPEDDKFIGGRAVLTPNGPGACEDGAEREGGQI